jgi:hypothetical protein
MSRDASSDRQHDRADRLDAGLAGEGVALLQQPMKPVREGILGYPLKVKHHAQIR